jgi:hypothetical protein
MNKRSRILAVLGAAVLTLGVTGVALAEELKGAHQGITVSWDEGGNASNDGDIQMLASCDGVTPEEGQVIVHFVQSGQDTAADPTPANNLLDAEFTGADDVNDVGADSVQAGGKNVDWYVLAEVTGDELVIDNATSNVTGGELRISHICAAGVTESTPPSNPPSNPPSFGQSFGGETDAPSEPSTDTFGGNGTSGPADGAWLLVVALGVLLASIVVLTPARAKSRR